MSVKITCPDGSVRVFETTAEAERYYGLPRRLDKIKKDSQGQEVERKFKYKIKFIGS